MNEYLFDFRAFASLRIKARTEKEAREKLARALDCATANFGEINGDPLIGEISIDDGEPDLIEINGEDV